MKIKIVGAAGGEVTDSPKDAVDLIVRSLPAAVRARLKPRG